MKSINNTLQALKSVLIYFALFFFPLFFLPLTEEFFMTGKLYMLAFISLIVILISSISIFIRQKFTWQKSAFDIPLILLILSYLASSLIASPNRVQSLLEPSTGFITIAVFTVFFWVLSQINSHKVDVEAFIMHPLSISTLILSTIAVSFFFAPLASFDLPQNLQFLKLPMFNTIGRNLDLALFLGFFAAVKAVQILIAPPSDSESVNKSTVKNISIFLAVAIALTFSVYSLLKNSSPAPDNNTVAITSTNIMPPFDLSWQASIETLKDPKNALLGSGPGNFVTLFTRIKPAEYNQTPLWQTNFTQPRSFLLQVLAETGILGLLSFLLLFTIALKYLYDLYLKQGATILPHATMLFYCLLVFSFFPPSFAVLFMFFITLALINHHKHGHLKQIHAKADLSQAAPFGASVSSAIIIIVIIIGILLARTYYAEFLYKSALNNLTSANYEKAYNNLREAISANPFIERFRLRFSQINLLIAINIARSAEGEITAEQRQRISQAIQAAITEAKSAVALNTNRATNWENLALVYRNILSVAEGADGWTISAYQRAIIADPSNPSLRINLGGVYYALENFKEAEKSFQQAINLKPNLANAHYNLAWTYAKQNDYKAAVETMNQVLSLTNNQSTDYKKAQNELEDFKSKIGSSEEEINQSTSSAGQNLRLQPSPGVEVSPKIEIPE